MRAGGGICHRPRAAASVVQPSTWKACWEYVVDGQNRRVGNKVNGTLVQGMLYAYVENDPVT